MLRAAPSPRVRATALALGGDAAYGLGAYRTAGNHYAEALQADQAPAEAAHTGFALGWAQLRVGRREQARHTWELVSRQFPADPGAPIALVQAAELAAQSGDLTVARTLLDRVRENYPNGPEAEVARLSGSVVAVRAGRAEEAVRDLRTLAHSGRPSVPRERRMLLDMLTTAGSPARRQAELRLMARYDSGLTTANGRVGTDAGAPVPPGAVGALERFASSFLDGAGDPETTPRVLHALALAAAEDNEWPDAQALSNRLADRFRDYPSTVDVLARIGGLATSAQQWPIARSSYERALALDRNAAMAPEARLNLAEAQFRTGATAQAQVQLNRFLEVPGRSEDAPRALLLLAEVNETLARPAEARAAYERLRREYPRADWSAESLLSYARLLQQTGGNEREARALLEEALPNTQGDARGEASLRLAQLLAASGEHEQAVDLYMSAAYGTSQSSRWHGPALLGAARSLAASHRAVAAAAVYRSLLPSAPLGALPRDGRPVPRLRKNVEDPETAAEASYGLGELLRESGRNAEAVDMYLAAASLAPASEPAWRGLVGAIRSLIAIRDWQSAAAIYQRLADSHRNAPEVMAEAKDALGPPPGRDVSRRSR